MPWNWCKVCARTSTAFSGCKWICCCQRPHYQSPTVSFALLQTAATPPQQSRRRLLLRCCHSAVPRGIHAHHTRTVRADVDSVLTRRNAARDTAKWRKKQAQPQGHEPPARTRNGAWEFQNKCVATRVDGMRHNLVSSPPTAHEPSFLTLPPPSGTRRACTTPGRSWGRRSALANGTARCPGAPGGRSAR